YSFDHAVRASKERWRHGETERFGGIEIDYQLVFRRRLHRQVGWLLLPLENTVDVRGRTAPLIDLIWAVGDQAAVGCKVPIRIDRRYTIARGESVYRDAVRDRDGMRKN